VKPREPGGIDDAESCNRASGSGHLLDGFMIDR
jgi:hypothetical protein